MNVDAFPFDAESFLPCTNGDVVIGSDVWIGRGATIMSGITIGHGAVIGANSTVTKNVAPYTIVGGNPAATIRTRFDRETVDALLETAWWDLADDQIATILPFLASSDTGILIDELRRIRSLHR